MWELGEIDFKKLYNYVIENPNSAYTISLLERSKYQWSILVYQSKSYGEFPLQFEIIIKNENKWNKGRCDFNISLNGICEIINIDSDSPGLGSVMFFILENIIKHAENDSLQITEIYGRLVNKHRINGDWLKAIPFYCMKAERYSYDIIFDFGSEKFAFKKGELQHDEKYMKSSELAKYLINVYEEGSFSIYRY